MNKSDQKPNPSNSIEVITRYERGKDTEYSVDGGKNWWTKTQFTAIQSLLQQAKLQGAREELERFKEYSYNLGFRGAGMEHLEARIKELSDEK